MGTFGQMATFAHSFDVEVSSPKLGERRLMSIGAVCLEISRRRPPEVINRFFAVIEWPGGLIQDHASTRTFWKGNPTAWKTNTTGGRPPAEVADALEKHLREVQRTAKLRRATYRLVSDNRRFDFAQLDAFLGTHSSGPGLPLRHNRETGWMGSDAVVDINERSQALRDVGIVLPRFAPSVAADHTPVNDAIANAERYAHYLRCTWRIRQGAL